MKRFLFCCCVGYCIFLFPFGSFAALYNPSTGHWYEVVSGNWEVAENAAIMRGGHLVTINNQAEQDWLINNFTGLSGHTWYWMGFNDAAVEGTWVWASGEPVSYTKWAAAAPNNQGNEDWGIMNYGLPGNAIYWQDVSLNATTYGIAEYSSAPVGAIPSAAWLLGSGLIGLFAFRRNFRK